METVYPLRYQVLLEAYWWTNLGQREIGLCKSYGILVGQPNTQPEGNSPANTQESKLFPRAENGGSHIDVSLPVA